MQFENWELPADIMERKKKAEEKERKSAQMENVKIISMCELYIINRHKDENAAVKKNSKCLKISAVSSALRTGTTEVKKLWKKFREL